MTAAPVLVCTNSPSLCGNCGSARTTPAFRDALLAGYRALTREVDVTHLDDFIAVRQVAFDLWYTGMAQVNPAFATKLEEIHRWSLAMLDLVEAH